MIGEMINVVREVVIKTQEQDYTTEQYIFAGINAINQACENENILIDWTHAVINVSLTKEGNISVKSKVNALDMNTKRK